MKKGGRPKKQPIDYPTVNYTYILYDLINKANNKKVRMPACSEVQAKVRSKVRFKKVKVKPSRIKEITDELGHTKANAYLKQFGNDWVCKNGQVFFRELK